MNTILTIIIPAYNEEKRIEKTLRAVSGFLYHHDISFEIIVVANNCTDNTIPLLESIHKEWLPELVVVDMPRVGNVGNTKGQAIEVGMKMATGTYHMFIDADNATNFEHVIDFMKEIESGHDIVIGSRYVKNAKVTKKQPFHRILVSRIGNFAIRLLLLPGIYDTQCGFKMFNSKASKEIFTRTRIFGWGADLEMLAIARKLGLKVREAPVQWEAQPESTVQSHHFIHTVRELFNIRKNIKQGLYE